MQTFEKFYLNIDASSLPFHLQSKSLQLSPLFYKQPESGLELETVYLIKAILASSEQKEKEAFLKPIFKKYKETFGEAFFHGFYLLFSIFMKQNYLGKDFFHEDADQMVRRSDKKKLGVQQKQPADISFKEFCETNGLPEFEFDKYGYRFLKSETFLKDNYREVLSVGGEIFPKYIQGQYLFSVLITMSGEMEIATGCLWQARLAWLHDQILDNCTSHNQAVVFKNYQIFFNLIKESKEIPSQTLAAFHIEHAHCLLFYYKYNESLSSITLAQDTLKMRLNFTGKLGTRTKYQTFLTPQLIAEVSEDPFCEALPSAISLAQKNANYLPMDHDLDSETILLKQPQLEEPQSQNSISIAGQLTILAHMQYLKKSQAQDSTILEQLKAYTELLENNKENWLIFSQLLLHRSLNEFDSVKRVERSLLQLESLVNQFNDKQPSLEERFQYFFAINYPTIFGLTRILAEKQISVGCVMSALKMYERLHMWEEGIECLAMAERHGEAKERCKNLEDFETNPKMLCLYGDLCQDAQYYKKAWKVSNKKYAKAKRNLAKVYFYSNNIEKAIKCFVKALNINSYDQKSWFTLGCAYLRLQQFQKAVEAFSACVQINDTDGEAWANLSNSFNAMGKKREAQSCLEKALQQCENNWRMWINLMIISLQNKDFSKFMTAVETLLNMDKKEIIDQQVCQKINQIFSFHIRMYQDETVNFKRLQFIKHRIDRLYKKISEKMGEKYHIWNAMAELSNQQIDFLKIKNQIQIQEDVQTEGQQVKFQVEKTPFNFRKSVQQVLDDKYEYLLNSCQCMMITGWEKIQENCEILEEQATKLLAAYYEGNEEQDSTKLKLFLKNIVPTIEETLNKQSKLASDLTCL